MVALVGVVGQREGGDDDPTGHVAHLLAQPLRVLADPLVSREAKPRGKKLQITGRRTTNG